MVGPTKKILYTGVVLVIATLLVLALMRSSTRDDPMRSSTGTSTSQVNNAIAVISGGSIVATTAMVDNVLTINIDGTHRSFVMIGGEVLRPQVYDLDDPKNPLTVSKLIELAGGRTEFAHHDQVELVRDGGKTNILRGEKALQLPLLPGDMITVPKR